MRICRIELDVPRQFRTSENWDLHADVWFPPQERAVTIETDIRTLRFGFKQTFLRIETRQKVVFRDHFQQEGPPIEDMITTTSEALSYRKGAGGILVKFLSLFEIGGSAGRDTKNARATVTAEKTQAKRYLVASIDQNIWELNGLDRPHSVLTGKVLQAQPLCRISEAPDLIEFKARVTARLNQLWVGVVREDGSVVTSSDQFNRQAVAKAIISKRLRSRAEEPDLDGLEVVLTHHSYQACKEARNDDRRG